MADILSKVEKMTVRIENEKRRLPQIVTPRTRRGSENTTVLTLWRIKSLTTLDANGAANNYLAYYTCQLCTFDATDYNLSNNDPIDYAGDDIIVFNLAEAGEVDAASLSVGDYLIGYTTTDDEGNSINIGFSPKFSWIA